MKIAIIDDSSYTRESLSNDIKKLRVYFVKTFEFGSEFIENDEYFDLIFLDGTLLNGISSYKVMEHIIKKDPDKKIIIFGGFQLDEIQNWLKLGAKDFISKPHDIEKIKEIIEKSS